MTEEERELQLDVVQRIIQKELETVTLSVEPVVTAITCRLIARALQRENVLVGLEEVTDD